VIESILDSFSPIKEITFIKDEVILPIMSSSILIPSSNSKLKCIKQTPF
jgi:hypothetical protein